MEYHGLPVHTCREATSSVCMQPPTCMQLGMQKLIRKEHVRTEAHARVMQSSVLRWPGAQKMPARGARPAEVEAIYIYMYIYIYLYIYIYIHTHTYILHSASRCDAGMQAHVFLLCKLQEAKQVQSLPLCLIPLMLTDPVFFATFLEMQFTAR